MWSVLADIINSRAVLAMISGSGEPSNAGQTIKPTDYAGQVIIMLGVIAGIFLLVIGFLCCLISKKTNKIKKLLSNNKNTPKEQELLSTYKLLNDKDKQIIDNILNKFSK